MQPRRQHQITRIRKPLIVSKGWIYLQCTGWGWVTPWVPETFMRGFLFGQVFIVETKAATATRMAKKKHYVCWVKQQLYTCSILFLVHFCFHCTTTTWKSPNFKSVCGGRVREHKTKTFLFFCDKVWCNVASLFKWRFRSRRRRRCLCPARKASHVTRTRLRVNRFSPDFAPDSWLAPNDHLPGW